MRTIKRNDLPQKTQYHYRYLPLFKIRYPPLPKRYFKETIKSLVMISDSNYNTYHISPQKDLKVKQISSTKSKNADKMIKKRLEYSVAQPAN